MSHAISKAVFLYRLHIYLFLSSGVGETIPISPLLIQNSVPTLLASNGVATLENDFCVAVAAEVGDGTGFFEIAGRGDRGVGCAV